MTNFGAVDVVPLLGAIAGCHCSVLWREKGRVTTNFGEWTFHCRVPMAPYTAMASRKSIQKSCLELLGRRYTVLYIDDTKIGFCYLGSMLVYILPWIDYKNTIWGSCFLIMFLTLSKHPTKQIQENHAEFSHCFFSWRRKRPRRPEWWMICWQIFIGRLGGFVFCHQTFQVPKMEESSPI